MKEPSSQPAALLCSQVTYSWGQERGVFGLTLGIGYGEACGLFGANGAGKTTLLNLCLGYLQPQAGKIWVAGIDAAEEPVRAKEKLAFVPEVARMYDSLTGAQNLAFFEGLMGRSHPRSEYEDLLASLGFPPGALGEPAATYSKGMRQKIAIAMGILKQADVFLLDEPTSGLDFRSLLEVSRLIRNLTAAGKAVFFSSHDLLCMTEVVRRVAVLHRGKLALVEDVEEFRRRDISALLQFLDENPGPALPDVETPR